MAGEMFAFPPDARRRIDDELLDDEEILWVGIDESDKAGRPNLGAGIVFWLAIAFLPTMFFVLTGWLVLQWLAVMGYILLGIGAFCLVFPIIVLVAFARARQAGRRRCWVLTNRGLLGVEADGQGDTIRAQPHQVESFGVSFEPEGRGTFIIEWRNRDILGDAQLTSVADADAALDILRRLAPGKEQQL
jgi:hypothetical protein